MSNKAAFKAGIWYTVSNFLTKGLAVLTLPIFTRIMSQEDIGLFSNVTSWISILAIVATFEIYSSLSIARFDFKDNLDDYTSSSLILSSLITIVFYMFSLVFHTEIEGLLSINFETLNIIFIYLIVYPAVQMFQLRNQIAYKYKPTIFVTLLNSILSVAFSLLLVLVMEDKLMGRIYGTYIPYIVIAVFVYIYILYCGKKISVRYWKYALRISFPLIFHLLAGYLLNSADKIMITKIISPDANALYSVAYTISTVASILWVSMNTAWSPWAYSMMDQKKYGMLKKNSKPYFLFYIIIVLSMVLFAPELLLLMGGEEYMSAMYVIPPVMVGYVFQFIYSLYVNIEFYHKKQRNIAIGTIVVAITNVVLNAIFIPIFGYVAAAYTTLVGYMLLFAIHYLLVKRLGCTSWYDAKFFLKWLGITLIGMMLCNILYDIPILRYTIIVCGILGIIIFAFFRKRDIMEAVKTRSLNGFLERIKKI